MKKEYVTPEVEMVKFIENEEIMTAPNTSMGTVPDPFV